MFTVLERNEITLIRDKSSFIGILVHATSVESAKQYLIDIKKEYPKAKHYCYAYSIQGAKKSSDDGEPAGTAGRPLLELLGKKEMDETLLVVVRYFGGVLLGASRLMSTYLETGVQVINAADIVEIKKMYGYKMILSYKEFDDLKRARYFIFRDVNRKLFVFVYTIAGEYKEAELEEKANQLDFSTKFRINFLDKYKNYKNINIDVNIDYLNYN